MIITELTVIGGVNKDGVAEPVSEISIKNGEIISIVGPTGSGKSTFIADIEQLAQNDTPSGRRVLINHAAPDPDMRRDPRMKCIAQLSQNMHFLADMAVGEFLRMHAKSRGRNSDTLDSIVERTIALANRLTGEPICADEPLTILSGGQSRALMTADIAVISDSPIVLIDEIENAGIRKQEALKLLAGEGKLVVVVTHDPVLALMAKRRIVMKNGGVVGIIETTRKERGLCKSLVRMDNWMIALRETIRKGELVEGVRHFEPEHVGRVELKRTGAVFA